MENTKITKSELSFLKRESELITLILSVYYPWQYDELESFKNFLNWGYSTIHIDKYQFGVSSNQRIKWDINLILKFKDKLSTDNLLSNPAIQRCESLSNEIIQAYRQGLLAREDLVLTDNKNQKLSRSDLTHYDFKNHQFEINSINWDKSDWSFFSSNEKFLWTKEFLLKYKNQLDWNKLSLNFSLPWDHDLIETFESLWNWNYLSRNESINWDFYSIEKYSDKLLIYSSDWKDYEYHYLDKYSIFSIGGNNIDEPFFEGIDCNVSQKVFDRLLPESKYTSGFFYKLNNLKVSINEVVVNRKWTGFSHNKKLNWTIKFIESYKDWWDWHVLSGNPSLPWSTELITRFDDYWDWDILSYNQSVIWNKELIEIYKERIRFSSVISINPIYSELENAMELGLDSNPNIRFDSQFIRQYEDKWNWRILSKNPSIIWNLSLFNKYKRRWHFGPELLCPHYKNLYSNFIAPIILKIGVKEYFNILMKEK